MDIVWFLILPAFIFCIGAAGVLTRRNPLVVLLCLELMLNAGNLALIAFARMHGNQDGQVFALIVMVIAACEVVIGLGIIVVMYRNRLPIDVDEMSELRDERNRLRLADPRLPARRDADHLAGLAVVARSPSGLIASGAIGLSFPASIGALVDLQDHPEEERSLGQRVHIRRRG